MNNETLASELIAEIQAEKHAIITELELLDDDFFKTAHVLAGVKETMEFMKEPKTLDDGLVQYSNIQSSLVYLDICYDYVKHIQTAIYDMIVREIKKDKEIREQGGEENGL